MSATTRRAAIGTAALASLAGIIGTATAKPIKPAKPAPAFEDNPDAKLIDACEDLLAQHAKIEALGEQRQTIADENRTDAQFDKLIDRQQELEAQIEKMHPQTFAGAVALAGVLVKLGSKDAHGILLAESFEQWIGIVLAEFLA